MLHDIAIVGAFFLMLIAPCLITLRSQRNNGEAAGKAANQAPPLSRGR